MYGDNLRERVSGSSGRSRLVPALIVGAVVLGLVLVIGLFFGMTEAQSDEVIVHKGGGIIEAPEAKGCIQPADKEWSRPGDSYYTYPAGQRFYDFSKTVAEGSDGDPFTVISSDNQPFTVKGTLFFTLNSDCDTLQKFHDELGARDGGAYINSEKGTENWNKILNIYMRPALESTLDRIAKKYPWKQLYSDLKVRDELNAEVNEKIRDLVSQAIDGDEDYFVGYSALIQQPVAPKSLIDSLLKEESSVAEGNAAKISAKAAADATRTKAEADAAAAEAAARAQIAQKTAELSVQKLQSQIDAAKVAPFGSAREYNNYLAIQRGLNPYQPVYGGGVLVDNTK